LKPEPEEIPDDEHELVLDRVCAIDVVKDSGSVCAGAAHELTRLAGEPGMAPCWRALARSASEKKGMLRPLFVPLAPVRRLPWNTRS
jgi:hypothetical protein